MKNRLTTFLAFLFMFFIFMACDQACKIDLSAITYDKSISLLPGEEIPISVSIDNPKECYTSYTWTTSAGSINPSNGSLNPSLITDCEPKNYSITLELKDSKGKIQYTRNIDISTQNPVPVRIADEYVSSGFFGDQNSISVDRTKFQGKDCDKFTFSPYGPEGFGGIYYQYPVNNWGDQTGKDLSGFNKVSFNVCSPNGAVVNFIAGGVADDSKTYKDSFKGVTGFKLLNETWQKIEIDLQNRDLSSVIGGFAWVTNREYNSSPVVFYVADIQYERVNCPE